jgi:SAM-dependent methyltransferase
MEDSEKSHIDLEKIRREYDGIAAIWDDQDRWHKYTQSRIREFIHRFFKELGGNQRYRILNAGSGGNDYGLQGYQLHVDIAASRLKEIPNSLISNIEQIPLADQEFDICLCVGSVINYCDSVRAVQEFRRLLKPGGWLILEFENSKSFEFLFRRAFNQSACIVETFYQNRIEELWVYSERHMEGILRTNGFNLTGLERFHILSPLAYRLTNNPNVSSVIAPFDSLVRFVPYVGKFCSNVILSCERKP